MQKFVHVPRTRIVRALLAVVIAVLAISACSGPPPTDPNVMTQPTTLPKLPQASAVAAGDVPPAVTEAQVLAAVKAAQTTTELPASISPADLRSYVQGEPEKMQQRGCEQGYSTTSLTDLAPCTVGNPQGTQTIVVIGDSNAQMWSGALDLAGIRNGWRVIVLTKNNCGPAAVQYYIYPLQRDYPECDAWQKWRMAKINELRPALVVLSGWAGPNTGPQRPMTARDWTTALATTIQQVPPETKTVLLSNQPHIKKTAGECLAQHLDDVSKCAEPASEIVPVDADRIIAESAAATNAAYLDVTPWFCDQTCPQVIADTLAYSSLYHITNDYAMYLSGVLGDALQPFMTS